MKQLKARDDSNFAKKTGNSAAKGDGDGGPIEVGYVLEAFPHVGPAEDNEDVKITKDNYAFPGLDNYGTVMKAYKHQNVDPDAETGE